jgi:hypothetical protein
MARPVEPRGGGLTSRILLGLVVLVVIWIAVDSVLGMVVSLVRGALLIALFGIVAWVVLVGRPGGRD